MTYEELENFITKKMKMQHIYQPVMLIALLESYGKCHQLEIAKSILCGDVSQLEAYARITNDMVGRVLQKNGIVHKEGKEYSLADYDALTPQQVNRLILECRKRLIDYIEGSGEHLWKTKASRHIPKSIRYETFKRARFCCELCGTSARERSLEVDHIVPHRHGGENDINNLQALCYSCNAMKRDSDDTDFREQWKLYAHRQAGCLFCNTARMKILAENNLAVAVRDNYPVTPQHTLIIPKRHVASYFELGQAEINATTALVKSEQQKIRGRDRDVSGFNVGVNDGEAAGQTILHCHLHLIPRRAGDVPNPRGGVRHIIPNKGNY